MNPICPFCEIDSTYSYQMSGYDIWMCNSCQAGFVYPMPSSEALACYYKGFLFEVAADSYEKVRCSFSLFLEYLRIKKGGLKLLDVGGGGGFFSRAFQELNYGDATYVDLDSEACAYAKLSGVVRVITGAIEEMSASEGLFDIVFARHIIEHVPNPTEFIDRAYEKLVPGGKLVLLMPNGLSREYLALPVFIFRKLKKVLGSNRFRWGLVTRFFGKAFHHGIDPLRHLWAINSRTLFLYCERMGYSYEIETFGVTNGMVSPYFRHSFLSLPHLFFGRYLVKRFGGAHLLCVITKPDE